MGTSRNAAEFSRKITALATVTERRSKETVAQGALTTKEIIVAEAAARGVSPSSKIAGGPWSVRYDIKGFQNPSALVAIRGPFHPVEDDTKPHFIAARGLGGSRRSRGKRAQSAAFVGMFGLSGAGAFSGLRKGGKGAKALMFGSSHYAYVRHPGTKGKGIFKSARKKAEKAVPIVMSRWLVAGWKSVLK